MCENRYNFVQPYNNFIHHYLQQHAIMSYHFQRMHNDIHHGCHPFHPYVPTNVHNEVDCCSSCSSCSCCSGNCSEASSEYEEVTEEMDSEEGYDEEQYQDEEYDEDECEYEFNVDAILAMRAAKEELKKQEMESKNEDSTESKDEDSDSKGDKESKSDSIVLIDSDPEDFEFVDHSITHTLDKRLFKALGGFNRTEEEFNRKYAMAQIFGEELSKTILGLEASMTLNFNRLCDKEQPSLWPVLPLRL